MSAADSLLRMSGQEGRQLFVDGNGTHPGTSATMWNTECLMEIEMAYVGAHVSRATQTNLGIHVCTIHVNQTTSAVNNAANLFNARLKHPMGRWIRHHECCELLFMPFCELTQIGNINVANVRRIEPAQLSCQPSQRSRDLSHAQTSE